MKSCGCFSPIIRWLKAPFRGEEEPRILEIGPPTNFRKEEFALPFSDDDTLTGHENHGVIAEKEAAQSAVVIRKPSKREQLKRQVQKLGAQLTA